MFTFSCCEESCWLRHLTIADEQLGYRMARTHLKDFDHVLVTLRRKIEDCQDYRLWVGGACESLVFFDQRDADAWENRNSPYSSTGISIVPCPMPEKPEGRRDEGLPFAEDDPESPEIEDGK